MSKVSIERGYEDGSILLLDLSTSATACGRKPWRPGVLEVWRRKTWLQVRVD